ncbi:hypothetical protein RvY_11243-1 [Ramazzottius varieornatus]|uniref:Uncharacterized protein n=1 Tax=Ramazzottius varieornatus TaxID=947166 RepID=A0A1D1VFG7_RAMVA|nr:hypothetical protein RvY_11243-1 [Ramazzottius varieornatus]
MFQRLPPRSPVMAAVDNGSSVNVIVFYPDNYHRNPHHVPSAVSYVQAWPLSKLRPINPNETVDDIEETTVCQVDIDGVDHNCLVLSMMPASIKTLAELGDPVVQDQIMLEARGIMHIERLKRRSKIPTASLTATKQPEPLLPPAAQNVHLPSADSNSRLSTLQNGPLRPVLHSARIPEATTPPSVPSQLLPTTSRPSTPQRIFPRRPSSLHQPEACPDISTGRSCASCFQPSRSSCLTNFSQLVPGPNASNPVGMKNILYFIYSHYQSSTPIVTSLPTREMFTLHAFIQNVQLRSAFRKPSSDAQNSRTYIVPAKFIAPPASNGRNFPRVAHNCPKPEPATKSAVRERRTPVQPTLPVMRSMHCMRAKRAASVMERDNSSDSEPDQDSELEEAVVESPEVRARPARYRARSRAKSMRPAEPARPSTLSLRTAAPPAAAAPVPSAGPSTSSASTSVRNLADINVNFLSKLMLEKVKKQKEAVRLVVDALFLEDELLSGVCTERALTAIRKLQVESDAFLLDQEKLMVARELVVKWMDAKTGTSTSANLFKT